SPLSRVTPARPPRLFPLSLHDALPISEQLLQVPDAGFLLTLLLPSRVVTTVLAQVTLLAASVDLGSEHGTVRDQLVELGLEPVVDRKSTRLNSSHVKISYAVFCLKKKK